MICNYGCGQEAIYQIGKKWCCSNSHNKCLAIKLKNSKAVKNSKTLEGKRKIQEKEKLKEKYALELYKSSYKNLNRSQKIIISRKLGSKKVKLKIVDDKKEAKSLEIFNCPFDNLTPIQKRKIAYCLHPEKYGSPIKGPRTESKKQLLKNRNKIALEEFNLEYKDLTMNQKKQTTSLIKYGVKHHMQLPKQREKFITTSLKKFGTRHPMQNAEIYIKNKKSGFAYKPYTFPSGKIILVQGYEDIVITDLLKCGSIKEQDIFTSPIDMPRIYYKDPITGVRRKYYPDIYIPRLNWIIEVKSIASWNTSKKLLQINLAKRRACKLAGYNFNFIYRF
jgi:hypothetical protein